MPDSVTGAACWCGADWLPRHGDESECQMPSGYLDHYCGSPRESHQLSEHIHTFTRRVCADGHFDNAIEVVAQEAE